ncbi:ABC transporter ATP-binding protein [uncultured Desulfobacter sp.]|uniref:ABC transporter ATP-binding protein n=1 Tax=uncultured Desulfobacter sp. TaxID=240139 RepID=UPI002AABB8DD|nr:ABC transporter ATP-binding protein [uncultured Desulfobacter sp.]
MPILEVENLKKYFPVYSGVFQRRTGWVHAVSGVSFSVEKGETLGIVGESGCGKTTLGRCILGLYELTDGQIRVNGGTVSKLDAKNRKKLSRQLQMIFQDPFESLNPRQTIQQILEEKYRIHGAGNLDLENEVSGLLEKVGLPADVLSRFPHEFSGGQRQRIGIARAISMSPQIIVCDEPVSALDVSVQSKILNLLLNLQETLGLTYVFISHDLSVVRHISDRIAVMYLGKMVEIADAGTIYTRPAHPYTRALLSAVPVPDPEKTGKRMVLKGEIPSVENPPPGCRFHTRCPDVMPICREKEPVLEATGGDIKHLTACFQETGNWKQDTRK